MVSLQRAAWKGRDDWQAMPADAELLAMFTVAPTAILGASENSAPLTWTFNSGAQAFEYMRNDESLI